MTNRMLPLSFCGRAGRVPFWANVLLATLLLCPALVPHLAAAAPVTAVGVHGVSTCHATSMHRDTAPDPIEGVPWIAATPASAEITAYLFFVPWSARGTAILLHTKGKMPNGANTKVLWIVDRSGAGSSISITGKNLSGPGTLHEEVPAAGGGTSTGTNYPSIVDVPTPGCWRFQLRSGSVHGSVTLRAVA